MGNSVRGLTEVKVGSNYWSPLVYRIAECSKLVISLRSVIRTYADPLPIVTLSHFAILRAIKNVKIIIHN